MYERFTDRARKVLVLSNQEAIRLNHEFIGPEHILLGLILEGSGIAANVLKPFGLDIEKTRSAIEDIAKPGRETFLMKKLSQTPRAKQVIERSIEFAQELDHNYVGTEHLLIGLLRVKEGVAFSVLKSFKVHEDETIKDIRILIGMDQPEDKHKMVLVKFLERSNGDRVWELPTGKNNRVVQVVHHGEDKVLAYFVVDMGKLETE